MTAFVDLVRREAGAVLGGAHGVDEVLGNLGVLDGGGLRRLAEELLVLNDVLDHVHPFPARPRMPCDAAAGPFCPIDDT